MGPGGVFLGRRSDTTLVAVVRAEDHFDTWRRAADGTWTATAPSPPLLARHGIASAWSHARCVFVGGQVDDKPVNTGLAYDADTDTWQALPPLPEPVADATLTALDDGTLVLTGGRAPQPGPDDPPRVLATAWRLPRAAAAWSALPPMPTPRFGHVGVALVDGTVLIAAGDDGRAEERFDNDEPYGVAAALRLDLKANTWKKAGTLPRPSVNPSAFCLPDGRVLIVGGEVEPIGVSSTSPALFEPARNAFVALPETPLGGHGAMTLLWDGRVLLTGGFVLRTDGTIPFSVDTSFLFDPTTRTFSPGPTLVPGRMGHAAALISGEDLLLIGGSSQPYPEDGKDPGDVEPVYPPPSVLHLP